MRIASKVVSCRNSLIALVAALAASTVSSAPSSPAVDPTTPAASCDASARSFICGLQNAEDLVRLPGTPWVVATGLNFDFSPSLRGNFGPLSAVRIDTHAVQLLYPSASSSVDWDRTTYPDCPKPPAPFSSHGINVTAQGRNSFRLYVANHGERQSVEIIDVTVRGRRLSTKWRGCLLAPAGIFPNAVVPLPDGRIALSGNGVAIWQPKGGWRKLDGLADSNGIELSKDGRWLYASLHNANSVVRVSVDGGAAQPIAALRFHADNLRWGDDGYLYVAGAAWPPGFAIGSCLSGPVCETAFGGVRIDPVTLATREVFYSEPIKGRFGMATVALRIGKQLWIGTARGDRVLILSAP